MNTRSKSGLRLAVIAFVTVAIATSALVSSVQTAAAASVVNIWSAPALSCIDDGHLQILRLNFNLKDVNALEMVRITLDSGTPDEKVLEFDGNGNILTGDPAFASVEGSTKFKTDGYYFLLAHLKGKFIIGIDKTELAAGHHFALAEIFTEGAASTPSDENRFELREACEPSDPDLVLKKLATPHFIHKDREYHAYITQKNEGLSQAGEHVIKLFLSYDDELDLGDEVLGQFEVDQLNPGRSKPFHIPFELPDDAVKGQAFLIAMTDADEEVDEVDEGNNDRIREIIVGAAAP
ncbi:MAG: CARDB domain-containing protein [Nitrososphaerales archaeon]